MEDTFIKIGKGENQGCLTEKIYKLDPMKKNLIENFLYARENMILLAKGTVGKDGKTTLADKATGRPININVGVIGDNYNNNSFELLELLELLIG